MEVAILLLGLAVLVLFVGQVKTNDKLEQTTKEVLVWMKEHVEVEHIEKELRDGTK